MSNPVPGASGGPDPSAEHARRHPPASESTQRQRSVDQGAQRYAHPEAQLGGADAVEKTTYVVGESAEPHGRPQGAYVAGSAAGGSNIAAWVVGGIAVLIALVYAIGVFR